MKHTITSNENRVIADIAIKAGFEDYVVYGERIEESLQKYPPEKNAEYRNMLKATFMSFIGAMTMIVDSKRVKGVGYTLAYNLYEYYLDDADISTDYNVIFDAKSRLSELYLRLGWATRKYVFSTYDEEKCLYKSEVIGYPKGNKVPNEKNKMVLGRGEAKRKTEAEKIAARVTLKKLDRTFHISEVPIDPS